MRSVFYVPGNRRDLIAKTSKIRVDVITLDLEGSVPPAEKQRAQELSYQNLKFVALSGADVYVRINSWETGMAYDDCEAVVGEGLVAICASCRVPDDVKRLDWKLEELEQKRGLKLGSIKIQLLIRTAKGIMNAYESALASKRVDSMIFGAVAYATDMGVTLTQPMGEEQNWARARIVCTAVATGIIPIDCPYLAFKDTEGFEKDTVYSRQLGFRGRLLIHPSQIEPCHRIYTEEKC